MTKNQKIIIISSIVLVTIAGAYFLTKREAEKLKDSAFQQAIDRSIQEFTQRDDWGWIVNENYFSQFVGINLFNQVSAEHLRELVKKGMEKVLHRIAGEALKYAEPQRDWKSYSYANALPHIQNAINKHNSTGINFGDVIKVALTVAPLVL